MDSNYKPPIDDSTGLLGRVPGLAAIYVTLKTWQAEFAPRYYERAYQPIPVETPKPRRGRR